ncbi:MAG: hemolysin [Candidatus Krumholzibacteriota bacterium]|nr:hemolysin [Candidatus Krumholzibacteriota bacterium]
MSVEVLAVIAVVAFLLTGFFSGAETAMLAADRVKIRHLAAKGSRPAGAVLEFVADPGYFLSLVLVGTNLAEIGCASTFTAIVVSYLGDPGGGVATAVLVPTLLVFGEIIPKGLFLYYSDRAAMLSIYPLKLFGVVLFPVVRLFSGASTLLVRVMGAGAVDQRMQLTGGELLFHLKESGDAGAIPQDTLTLASRAFEFLDLKAGDVMIPVRDVVMVEEGKDIDEYEKVFFETRFTRLPVYRGSRNVVAGILSVQGLLEARPPREISDVLEEPYEVGIDTPVSEILVRMRRQGCHMAMVRGPEGDVVGMTTLEDVVERLVGAMSDEFH